MCYEKSTKKDESEKDSSEKESLKPMFQNANGEPELGKEIIQTSKAFRCYLDSQMPYEEVTGAQGRMLGMIVFYKHRGINLYQKDIEAAFSLQGATVTAMLKRMEKKELIYKESVPEDARLKRLLPTEKGILIQAEIMKSIVKTEREIRELFTKEELETTLGVLSKMKNYIKEKENETS